MIKHFCDYDECRKEVDNPIHSLGMTGKVYCREHLEKILEEQRETRWSHDIDHKNYTNW